MKNFLDGFKSFAFKGNVVDLAVGVIIGGAFGKIITSLVADIIMPLIGIIAGGIDFKGLGYTVVNPLTGTQAKVTYGLFLQNVFDFLVVALTLFIFVTMMQKAIEKARKAEVKAIADAPKNDEVLLLEEIRDLLVSKSGTDVVSKALFAKEKNKNSSPVDTGKPEKNKNSNTAEMLVSEPKAEIQFSSENQVSEPLQVEKKTRKTSSKKVKKPLVKKKKEGKKKVKKEKTVKKVAEEPNVREEVVEKAVEKLFGKKGAKGKK